MTHMCYQYLFDSDCTNTNTPKVDHEGHYVLLNVYNERQIYSFVGCVEGDFMFEQVKGFDIPTPDDFRVWMNENNGMTLEDCREAKCVTSNVREE